MREIYVVSDIHLGGDYPSSADPEDRGFRINTHATELARFVDALADKPVPVELIVNGDLVDFLAERSADNGGWVPFRSDQAAAVSALDALIRRDTVLFTAFARLLAKGHRLVLLLGNHDIELALPRARRALEAALGVTGREDFHFIYDGEAYQVGSALIEHGNRYDPFNIVDNDGLRRLRSLLSRNQPVPPEWAFEAPAGSHMVARVMNPIKNEYRFVDLLKPDSAIVVPLLLALEPGLRRVLSTVAAISIKTNKHKLKAAAMPSFGGDISAGPGSALDGFGDDISAGPGTSADPLDALVRGLMKEDAGLVLEAGSDPLAAIGGDISTYETIDRSLGLARLLFSRDNEAVSRRLRPLLAALRVFQNDTTFQRDAECLPEYLNAARDLAINGPFEYVLFGHTHYARDVALDGGARYLNTGTWADLICFPQDVVSGPEPKALDALRAFVDDLHAGRLKSWVSFIPTYARLEVEGSRVVAAAIHDYTSPDQV